MTVTGANDCISKVSSEIGIDTVAPDAIAVTLKPLCLNAPALVSGKGSIAKGDIVFNWISVDAPNISINNLAQVELSSAGRYLLKVTDLQNNCYSFDTFNIPEPEGFPGQVTIQISQPTCSGKNGVIEIGGFNFGQFKIDFQSISYDSVKTFTGLTQGKYSFIIEKKGGCKYDTSIQLLPPPKFTVLLISDTSYINQGSEINIEAIFNVPDSQIKTIQWQKENQKVPCDKCFNLADKPLKTLNYKVQGVTIDECIADAELTIFVRQNRDVYTGNAFSPNSDGTNDFFLPYFGKSIENASMFRIFDRWGNLVFSQDNLQLDTVVGWDGKINGQEAPYGVYVYLLKVKYIDGREDVIKGEVNLIR